VVFFTDLAKECANRLNPDPAHKGAYSEGGNSVSLL
jgi:hypothetical protein